MLTTKNWMHGAYVPTSLRTRSCSCACSCFLNMKRLVISLVFLSATLGFNAQAEQKLIGATPVKNNDYRWVAAVYGLDSPFGIPCTGVLIDQSWVLTAANCVQTRLAGELRVILGRNDLLSTNGESHRVSRIVGNATYLLNQRPDIALLELTRPSAIEAVALLPSSVEISSGRNLLLTGFGIDQEEFTRLKRRVLVRAINERFCSERDVLCAGQRSGAVGAGPYDMGTPVLAKHQKKWKLAGIVNSTIYSGDYNIRKAIWPQNYFNLATQQDWIRRQITGNASAGETTDLLARNAVAQIYCYDLQCDYDARRSNDGRIGFLGHSWDFGDGVTRAGAVVTHKYASPGRYSITLTNTLTDGSTSQVTKSVQLRNGKIVRGKKLLYNYSGVISRSYAGGNSVVPAYSNDGIYVFAGPLEVSLEEDNPRPLKSLDLRIEKFNLHTGQWTQLAKSVRPNTSDEQIRLDLKRSAYLRIRVSSRKYSYTGFKVKLNATVHRNQCWASVCPTSVNSRYN